MIITGNGKKMDKQALVLLKLAAELTNNGFVEDIIREAISRQKAVVKNYE